VLIHIRRTWSHDADMTSDVKSDLKTLYYGRRRFSPFSFWPGRGGACNIDGLSC
jgi:hypothetical protein